VAASNDGSLCVVEDTSEIEAFMRRDAGLHVYEIGDLDPFFRPRTRWFGWRRESLEALCLLYTGSETPTLVALGRPDEAPCIARLLHALEGHLPPRIYAHLSPGLDECFPPRWAAQRHGRHLKMQLTDHSVVGTVDITGVTAVAAADAEPLAAFYDEHYPGHWFDPRMLDSGQYRAVRADGRWLAAAGVHVYSASYRVAALGNIVTARDRRGRGLGRTVTAAVCTSLLGSVDVIGLNVLADNTPARTCYEKLGFSCVAEYEEMLLERR
jgi:ribosomal protein S18 acetylase RimI-like enzyme